VTQSKAHNENCKKIQAATTTGAAAFQSCGPYGLTSTSYRSAYVISDSTAMRNLINLLEAMEKGCPPATQSIDLNLKNRQKAIDDYHYGPLNPNEPNEEYWAELADEWNTNDIESVKQNRCGNCAAFDISEDMLDCIAKGIGSEPGSDPHDTIDAGDLGYCKFLKFKCAAKRTCDAWVEGGPVTK
jgi:hypothetical protein